MSSLENVAVGTIVGIWQRRGWSHRLLKTSPVERVTATRVVAFGGRRFNKKSGCEIGYGSDHIFAVTDAHREDDRQQRAEIKAESICHRLAGLLAQARGDEATKYAAMLPGELLALAFDGDPQ